MSEQQAYIDNYGKKTKVLDIYMSYSGWIWYVTRQPKAKNNNIWFGLVKGLYTEWGSFYKHDLLDSSDIFRVPKEEWKNVEGVFFK